jgi:hypothetical protein
MQQQRALPTPPAATADRAAAVDEVELGSEPAAELDFTQGGLVNVANAENWASGDLAKRKTGDGRVFVVDGAIKRGRFTRLRNRVDVNDVLESKLCYDYYRFEIS